MKKTNYISFLVALVVLSGCLTTQKITSPPQSTSMTFEASKAKVWELLVEGVGLSYPILAIERESGLLTTSFVDIDAGWGNRNMSLYVYPPKMFLATWDGLRMKMNILVTEAVKGKTHVQIRTHYDAFETNLTKSWQVCQTNGSVENNILASIKSRLLPSQSKIHKENKATDTQHHSNTTPYNLRRSYQELSVSQVQSIPNVSIREKNRLGFIGYSTINHDYDLESINGDKVVIDRTTRLMWQQSGSKKYMSWKKAQKWVKELNKKGYADYHDWRLPTVEEASSLLESSQKNGHLYIDTVFSQEIKTEQQRRYPVLYYSTEQEWIWTGDESNSDGAWTVRSDIGGVSTSWGSYFSIDSNYYLHCYVRPVRSLASSDINNVEETEKKNVLTSTNNTYQQVRKSKLVYKANTSQIRAELQAKGYKVIKVGFEKNQNGAYCMTVYIETKGNYDKEAFDMHRIMFDNAYADFYFSMISDYELQTAWSFRARRKTLSDYFSGKISEQEYIHQVKTEKIL